MKLGVLEAVATQVESAARMTVVDPDERVLIDADGKECWIDFLSADSEAGRKVERSRNRAQFARARSGRNTDIDDDPVEVQVEILTALATGWYFGPDADPFSKAAAKALFADPEYAWLRKRSYTFVYSAANFIKRSSKTSSPSPSTSSAGSESSRTAAA